MKLPAPKRRYCAYCGKLNESLGVVWQDEEGRTYRFHLRCGRLAESMREKAKLPLWGK